ncbi:MAG: guanylate kinase [Planctomycetota bacterium]
MANGDATATPGRLVVISGPSGVGKGTIVRRVLETVDEAVAGLSVTTRAPRPGERDGIDYRFVSVETFRRMIDTDALLEWAEVHGHYYGTEAAAVDAALAAGKIVILEIDVQGGLQVARRRPSARLILITPPGDAELRRRLEGRGTDAPDVIERRLAKAHEEMRMARDSGRYTNEVVNDDLDDAVRRVVGLIRQENPQHD